MRPVNRHKGKHYFDSRKAAVNLGSTKATKILAASVESEMRRLSHVLQGVAEPAAAPMTQATYDNLHAPVVAAIRLLDPATPVIGAILASVQAAAASGSVDNIKESIRAMPLGNKCCIVAEIINRIGLYNPNFLGPFDTKYGINEMVRSLLGLPPTIGVFVVDPMPNLSVIYDAAVEDLGAHSRLIDNYVHYFLMRKNLQYVFSTNTFTNPAINVNCIPYACSAIHDTRRRLLPSGANLLYASNITVASPVSDVSVGVPGAGVGISFSLVEINTALNSFYTSWESTVEAIPMDYRESTTELLDTLGAYCAYCESKIGSDVNVEHILPKGKGNSDFNSNRQGFSSLGKSWENFLPACGRCNSTKGSRPTKHEITQNALIAPQVGLIKDDGTNIVAPLVPVVHMYGGVVGGDFRLTDKEYARLNNEVYQFPLDNTSYQNTGYRLHDASGFGAIYTATTIVNQINWTIAKVDENSKDILVNTPGAATATMKFEVHIDQWGAGCLIPSTTHLKMDRMVDICGFNSTFANTDRRVIERTEAWFMALEAVNRIQAELAAIPGDIPGGTAPIIAAVRVRTYNNWRDGIIKTIKEKGFFTLWMKIFREFDHPLPAASRPRFPLTPAASIAAGTPFLPMINGNAAGLAGGAAPARGAVIGNLAQDIAQTILSTGEGVSNAAINAAGISLGIVPLAAPNVIPLAGAVNVGLGATWTAAGGPQIVAAEAAARRAAAFYSKYFPNTDWTHIP